MNLKQDYGDVLGYVVKNDQGQVVLVDKEGILLPTTIIQVLYLPEVSVEDYKAAAKEALSE